MKTPVITNFDDFGLSSEMSKAIAEMGFTTPSPIQVETIPLLHKKHTDFLGLAATGTGKTAAYGIPLLENMKKEKDGANAKGVQALILCPTRELAKQVAEQMNLLARYKKTKCIAIYGGADYAGQLRALKDGASIAVGTPGRIIDHLERGTLNLNHLQTVVLDEADEMISMGFKSEIEFILEKVQQEVKHQTWLFSATMSRDVRKIADQFLSNPKQIQINKTEVVASGVKQVYYQVREDEKPAIIEKVIDLTPDFYGLIFCQTKALVVDLTQTLKNDGYAVDCLHGDMEQNARERTMKAFKARQVSIVVCTDVASRGIDVKDLTHVINYSLPRELDLYVHRIGRTGRGGKEGIALSLVTTSHLGLVYRIEKTTQSKMTKLPVPSDSELLKVKVKNAHTQFIASAPHEEAVLKKITESLGSDEWKATLKEMTKEELVAKFLMRSLKLKLGSDRPAASEGFRGDRGRDRDDRGPRRDRSDRGPRREWGERSAGGAGSSRDHFGNGRRGPRDDRGGSRFAHERTPPAKPVGERGSFAAFAPKPAKKIAPKVKSK